jgi:hypothetical protein
MNLTAGIAAAVSYTVLSLSPSVLGLAGHATHFVMLPVLAGILVLLTLPKRGGLSQIFAGGLLFGLGLLTKQPALFFILFGALYVAFGKLCNFVSHYPTPARLAPGLLLGAALGWPIYQARNIFFHLTPIEACQTIYSGNPFVESVRAAPYLRDRTSSNEQIAVLGSEPEIYFYAHRHSATGYIYTYGLVEGQPYASEMQREMVREIELSRPKYLVVIGVGASWLSKPGVRHPIFDWITDYTRQNYDLVGFVNMLDPGRTDYYFDDIPESFPELGNRIFVDRKKL